MAGTSFGIYGPGNYAGVDQGVDFRGRGQIPALDIATVTDVGKTTIVETGGKQWNYVVYLLHSGPYRGRYVYVAENFVPSVHVGQNLRKGQSIGYAPGAYPYTETGFNRASQGWAAYGSLGSPQPAGNAMKSYIYGLIGSAPPVTVPSPASSNTSTGGGVLGTVGTVVGDIANPGAAIVNAGGGIIGTATGVVHGVESVGSFLGKLTDPTFWLRAFEVVGGVVLVILGLYLLARQVGLAPDVPAPVRQAANRAPGQDGGDGDNAPAPRQRSVVHHYHVDEASEARNTRRKRLAASSYDPATSEIPF